MHTGSRQSWSMYVEMYSNGGTIQISIGRDKNVVRERSSEREWEIPWWSEVGFMHLLCLILSDRDSFPRVYKASHSVSQVGLESSDVIQAYITACKPFMACSFLEVILPRMPSGTHNAFPILS